MDSIDSVALARLLRRRYEWSRVWRAVLGFAPACLLILVAAYISPRSISVLLFGAVLFGNGVLLLWYGQGLQRAVLPGVVAGLIPLISALCANQFGHVCTGDGCVSLCLPACIFGGVSAGALLGYWARRRSLGFLLAASCLALLTGAGVFGLAAGYAVGVIPVLLKLKARA
jgi:hypothetical protein